MKFILSSIAILWFTTILVIAQPPVPTLPPEPEPVPITGLEFLLLGGGAYGIYKFKKKTNKNNKA